MITRFDHAVIAVRNLDEAMDHYRTLGFDVSPGVVTPGVLHITPLSASAWII
jgi:hypothetical protein